MEKKHKRLSPGNFFIYNCLFVSVSLLKKSFTVMSLKKFSRIRTQTALEQDYKGS